MEVGNDATIELEFGFSISLFVGGGFTLIHTSDDYESLLGSNGQLINLKPREHVLDDFVTQAIYINPDENMISDNRIITSNHDDDTWGADNILYYRILDYYGHEIRKISSSKFIIKRVLIIKS